MFEVLFPSCDPSPPNPPPATAPSVHLEAFYPPPEYASTFPPLLVYSAVFSPCLVSLLPLVLSPSPFLFPHSFASSLQSWRQPDSFSFKSRSCSALHHGTEALGWLRLTEKKHLPLPQGLRQEMTELSLFDSPRLRPQDHRIHRPLTEADAPATHARVHLRRLHPHPLPAGPGGVSGDMQEAFAQGEFGAEEK